jgi:hypothetical protein
MNTYTEIQIHEYLTLPLNENFVTFTLRLLNTKIKSPAYQCTGRRLFQVSLNAMLKRKISGNC